MNGFRIRYIGFTPRFLIIFAIAAIAMMSISISTQFFSSSSSSSQTPQQLQQFSQHQQRSQNNPQDTSGSKRKAQIAFVIDTTGSMSNLISAAQRKVWGIVNKFQQQFDRIELALIAYRDSSDEYETRVTQFSSDLDSIYSTLMQFSAAGGGDTPENVRKALYEAVTELQWNHSQEDQNLNSVKTIFLVGDAPSQPYRRWPATREIAGMAKRNGIVVNAIQCGEDVETTQEWKDIALYGGGSYFTTGNNDQAARAEIKTPFDQEILKLGEKLSEYYIPRAASRAERATMQKMHADKQRTSLNYVEEAQLARNINKANRKDVWAADRLSDLEDGTAKLESLRMEELEGDERIGGKTVEEKRQAVSGMLEERRKVKEEIQSLSEKRERYLKSEHEKESVGARDKDTMDFDSGINEALEKLVKKL
eukprot:TRINITY_DN7631_c0_g1_i1.p1 TRINITY_DN7631_c0_g1~~TRINITY_DN7631_c0_g1_i1.p1  ORF type:complete len:422 (-),score=117.64 TRINITY_DN7631_c0_g1_i1:108-1373(-)